MGGEVASGRSVGVGRTPVAVRIGAGLAVVLVLGVGVLLWGRVASSERVAMLLTVLWFGVVLGAGLLAVRARRALLLPMATGYALTAVVVGLALGLPELTNREVNEQVATGAPAGQAGPGVGESAAAGPTAGQPAAGPSTRAPRGNVELARGGFATIAHPGRGTAAVVELATGGRVLTLTGFSTDNGPDLRVYLTAKDPAKGGDIGRFVDLGALKGNRGNQQYDIPDGVDLDRYTAAVIWCRAFTVAFTSAPLAAGAAG